MTIVKGGRTNFGEPIGIIMLDTVFPRIPGDVGNASTFPFPVRYRVVEGASIRRVVQEADPGLLEPFIDAARSLEREGVRAISTSCGFLAIFHREMKRAVHVPLITSSLQQVPMACSMIREDQKVAVITARAASLTERHFQGVGIENIPLVVEGLDEAEEFNATIGANRPEGDMDRIREEVVAAALRVVKKHPEVGALVMECTNLPPYSRAVQDAVKLPVFDIVTLIRYTYSLVVSREYRGIM
ncbi:MAG: aspartate/glutamate racemase family protein [Deltaproteobacteria bacterium]|nr:aspartate/glutamate racemase family protein [Deltaproteobacteria bacterium]